MIRILINAKKGYIKVEGHSNYAPFGQDIICAGVSSIVNGMYLYFHNLKKAEEENKSEFITKLKYNEDGVQFEVNYDTKNITNIVVVNVFAIMFTQFDDFKGYVKFTYKSL